jgi:fatty acid desaturase
MTSPLTHPGRARPVSDYAQLLAQVHGTGLLDRSPARYLPRLLTLATMAGAGVAALIWLGDSWWQLGLAAYLGIVFAQIGFLGHDAGHQQIFRTRQWNDLLGLLLSNLGIGLSYGWWVDKHNRHHRNPNEIGRDPDVNRNVIAWTDQQARAQRGVLRLIARHQAACFFPLLLLEGWNLHVGSVRTLVGKGRGGWLELTLLTIHTLGSLALLLAVLSPAKALAFVAVQQAMFGLYLGSTFAPNHKGMQIIDGTPRPDFFRRQVLTSRNIVGGRLITAAVGGLNYQIEHHLFPSMPSRNLRKCRPLVKAFCEAQGVAYTEARPLDSYRQSLRYLSSVRPSALPAGTHPSA